MFSYYGSKSKIVHLYPPPMFPTVVEPFAGSARYALRYADRKVILNDLDPTIAGIWRYLIHEATPERIAQLPELKVGERLDSIPWLTNEERDLMGFGMEVGYSRPGNVVRKRALVTGLRNPYDRVATMRARIMAWMPYRTRWSIRKVDYQKLPDIEATWFVDPPYSARAGRNYKYNKIDYAHLAEWCRTRKGQVIVCEGAGAEWLPFRPLGTTANGSKRSLSAEKWWSNYRRASLWEKVAEAKDWVPA